MPVPSEVRVKFSTLIAVILMTAIGVGVFEAGKSAYDKITAEPVIDLPAQVTGNVGDIIPIVASGSAKDLRWHSTDKNLHIADRQYVNGTSTILVTSPVPGTYTVSVHGALHSQTTEIQSTQVIIKGTPTPVPPGPTPVPPGPTPIPGDGLHVMIVYDEKTLPSTQQSALNGTDVRTYLNTKAPNNWRMWKSTVDSTNEDQIWKDAFAKAKGKTLPWIIISNGKTGFEGPLPADSDAMLTLLKTYGG